MTEQLLLFEGAPTPLAEDRDAAAVAATHAEARAIAADLSPGLHFGTSSWAFPGWTGLVFSGAIPPALLARDGLREYARHPLLTTVGIDRTYYAPIPVEDLRRYADQLPAGFRCCTKAPAAVTGVTLGPGSPAALNPDFLSVDRLSRDLLEPFAAAFAGHTGPFILEFPPAPRHLRLEPDDFLARRDRFLSALPRDFEYAVELRDARLLTPAYRRVLARHGAAHTYNYWSAMPMPGAQADVIPPDELPFAMVRLLLRPGTWYEDQRERFAPFSEIVAPDEAMRDEVAAIGLRALAGGRRVYVLVNNKAEGSSPRTILELARRVRDRQRRVQSRAAGT